MTLDPRFTLHAYETLASTNDEARRLARDRRAPTLSLVWARQQSAGRGRMDRTWQSPEGNLYWSCLVRLPGPMPSGTPVEPGELCFVAAAAVLTAVRQLVPAPVAATVKWPNDVLIEGAKVAGILIEAEAGAEPFAVVGIGLNVGWAPTGTPYPATNLAAWGAPASVETAFETLSNAFLHHHDVLLTAGAAAVRRMLDGQWAGQGDRITVRTAVGERTGVFDRLDAQGRLCLRLDDGRVETLTVGDVFFP